MSHAVIVQPDGRLAVWSTAVDALVVWDATDDELVEWLAADAADRARRAAAWIIARTRDGKGPRHLPTYAEAVARTRERFPDDAPGEVLVTLTVTPLPDTAPDATTPPGDGPPTATVS